MLHVLTTNAEILEIHLGKQRGLTRFYGTQLWCFSHYFQYTMIISVLSLKICYRVIEDEWMDGWIIDLGSRIMESHYN